MRESLRLPNSTNGYLVEIFMDESEVPPNSPPPRAICAGGIVLVRSQGLNHLPVLSDQALWEALKASSNLWGWCSDTPQDFEYPRNQPDSRGYLPKGRDLHFEGTGDGAKLLCEALDSINAALGKAGLLFPFALIDNRSDYAPDWISLPRSVGRWESEKALDLTLKSLIRDSLEALLFHHPLITRALECSQSSLAIDLGSREYPCRLNTDLFDMFGIQVFRDGMRPSLYSEDGYRIVAEVSSQTGLRWPYPAKISRARAVTLRDFGGARGLQVLSPPPRQIHYLADTVSHVALADFEPATRSSKTITDFFLSGWITDYRQSRFDECLLFSTRRWHQGDRVGALLDLVKRLRNIGPSNATSHGYCEATARDASRWPQSLTAHEFRELFARCM